MVAGGSGCGSRGVVGLFLERGWGREGGSGTGEAVYTQILQLLFQTSSRLKIETITDDITITSTAKCRSQSRLSFSRHLVGQGF